MHESSPRIRKLHAEERNAGPAPLSGARRPWNEASKFIRSCGWIPSDYDVSLRWSEAAPGTWVRVMVKHPRGTQVAYRWVRWFRRSFYIASVDPTTPSPAPGKVAG